MSETVSEASRSLFSAIVNARSVIRMSNSPRRRHESPQRQDVSVQQQQQQQDIEVEGESASNGVDPNLEKARKAFRRRIGGMQAQLQRQQGENRQLNEALAQMHQQQIVDEMRAKENEAQLAAQSSELEKHRKEVNQLSRELQAIRENPLEAPQVLEREAAYKRQLAELRDAVTTSEAKILDLHAMAYATADDRLDILRTQLNDATAELLTKERSILSKDSIIAELRKKTESLSKEREALQSDCDKASGENDEAKSECEHLVRVLAAKDITIRDLRHQLRESQDALSDQIVAREEDGRSSSVRERALRESIAQLTRSLDFSKDECKSRDVLVHSLQQDVEQLTEKGALWEKRWFHTNQKELARFRALGSMLAGQTTRTTVLNAYQRWIGFTLRKSRINGAKRQKELIEAHRTVTEDLERTMQERRVESLRSQEEIAALTCQYDDRLEDQDAQVQLLLRKVKSTEETIAAHSEKSNGREKMLLSEIESLRDQVDRVRGLMEEESQSHKKRLAELHQSYADQITLLESRRARDVETGGEREQLLHCENVKLHAANITLEERAADAERSVRYLKRELESNKELIAQLKRANLDPSSENDIVPRSSADASSQTLVTFETGSDAPPEQCAPPETVQVSKSLWPEAVQALTELIGHDLHDDSFVYDMKEIHVELVEGKKEILHLRETICEQKEMLESLRVRYDETLKLRSSSSDEVSTLADKIADMEHLSSLSAEEIQFVLRDLANSYQNELTWCKDLKSKLLRSDHEGQRTLRVFARAISTLHVTFAALKHTSAALRQRRRASRAWNSWMMYAQVQNRLRIQGKAKRSLSELCAKLNSVKDMAQQAIAEKRELEQRISDSVIRPVVAAVEAQTEEDQTHKEMKVRIEELVHHSANTEKVMVLARDQLNAIVQELTQTKATEVSQQRLIEELTHRLKCEAEEVSKLKRDFLRMLADDDRESSTNTFISSTRTSLVSDLAEIARNAKTVALSTGHVDAVALEGQTATVVRTYLTDAERFHYGVA